MAVDLPISTLALGAVLIFAVAFALRPRRARFAAPLPPAPKTSVPLIGHTLMMSGVKYAWVSFYEIWKSMGEEACKSGVMYMKRELLPSATANNKLTFGAVQSATGPTPTPSSSTPARPLRTSSRRKVDFTLVSLVSERLAEPLPSRGRWAGSPRGFLALRGE